MNVGSFDPSVEFTSLLQLRRPLSGIREVFFTAIDYDKDINDYRGREVGANQDATFTFHVPNGFVELIDLVLVGIAAATVNDVDIDLHSDYAMSSEDSQINSESDVISTFSFIINQITEIDISLVYTNLQAGHYCGLFMDHNNIGTTVRYIGIRLRYRRD